MTLQIDFERVRLAHKAVRAELLTERTSDGHWLGEVAGSPLATATALSALVLAHDSDAGATLGNSDSNNSSSQDKAAWENIVQGDLSELIVETLHWLARYQNEDGGWGDCLRGRSNLATTLLVQAAFRLTVVPAGYADLIDRVDEYVAAQGGAANLRQRLGKNHVLAAPILANCALAGMVPWRQVPSLPFELACLPPRWRERLKGPLDPLEVPTLVAIGLAKFHHERPRNPLTRVLRNALRTTGLSILESLQAEDGSFLQTIPLTAFVVMSLASVGYQHHQIVHRGVEFLFSSMRADASWPIVPNLAVRNTTLAINSLTARFDLLQPAHNLAAAGFASQEITAPTRMDLPERQTARWHAPTYAEDTLADSTRYGETVTDHASFETDHRSLPTQDIQLQDDQDLLNPACMEWLLSCQTTKRDGITGTPPGGWGWNDSPGALPNSDDTAGALKVLATWHRYANAAMGERIERAAQAGIDWLLAVQKEDGGWPAIHGGRSTASYQLSAADPTGHTLQALAAWHRPESTGRASQSPTREEISREDRIKKAMERGVAFLASVQREDGSFLAMRFGNEYHADAQNPVVGTSCVLMTCAELDRLDTDMASLAARWLLSAQHAGGGWGPPRAPLDYSNTNKNGSSPRRENDALAKNCSIEETALAVTALMPLANGNSSAAQAVSQGLAWLVDALEQDAQQQPAVIGFYLGRLWYHERLYPLIFAAGALTRAVRQLAPRQPVPAAAS
jgi:squalene-hopene/tetraprenyl-beta-curcumene cyclase